MTNKVFFVLLFAGFLALFIIARHVNLVKRLKEENGKLKQSFDGLQEEKLMLEFEVRRLSGRG